jgi:uncharacterized protein YjiS (DUF1127 family)
MMTIRQHSNAIDATFPDGFARETLFRTQGDMLAPGVTEPVGVWRRMVAAFSDWRMKRAGRLVLRDLDDHALCDIGITRAEALREVRKSFYLD